MSKLEKVLLSVVAILAVAMMGYAFKGKTRHTAASPKLKQFLPPIQSDVEKFVSEQRLADPKKSIFESAVVGKIDPTLKKLSGNFRGFLRSDTLKQDLLMEASFAMVSTPKGVTSLIAGKFAHEKTVLPVKYASPLRSIKGLPGKLDSALVQVSNDAVLQLFYLSKSDEWVGNYYRLEADEKVQYLGTMQLVRI